MVPFRRSLVRVGAFGLHVMESGHGRPVVMVHGNPAWGFLYRKVAQALASEPLRVVMPDLLGFGLSDKPVDGSVHSLELHADLLARLLTQLEVERPVLVVQDWGGPIGVAAGMRLPLPPAGLVVLNTVLTGPRPGSRGTWFHQLSRVPVLSTVLFRGLGLAQGLMHFVQGDPASMAGDVGRAYRWVLRDVRSNVAPLALARMVPDGMDHPSVPLLQQVDEWVRAYTGPAEIVWGERDPILGKTLRRLQGQLPHAAVTVTRAGHFLQEEEPQAIAAAVRRVVAASS
jgi:cis-3-alkyl-4-acyloxetan-2-one decarboxylase